MYSIMITFVTYPNGGIVNTTSQIVNFETRARAEESFRNVNNIKSALGCYEAVRLY